MHALEMTLQFAQVSRPACRQAAPFERASQTEDIFPVSVVIFLEKCTNSGVYSSRRSVAKECGYGSSSRTVKKRSSRKCRHTSARKSGRAAMSRTFRLWRTRGKPRAEFRDSEIHPQKFCMNRRKSLPPRQRKHVPHVGIFEQPRASVPCARKRAAHVAKELALQQRSTIARTMADRQAVLAYRTDLVDGTGNELFARSRRPHSRTLV